MNKDFEHTQPLPRVSPDMESQKTQLLNVGKVRELEPVEIPRRQQQTDNGGYGGAGNMPPGDNTGINGMNSMNSINGRNGMNMNVPGNPPQKDRPGGRGKMIALLSVGFVVAAFCGAALSGYLSEQQAKKEALDSQHAAATRQLQEADSQQESLSRKKERLEAEYQRKSPSRENPLPARCWTRLPAMQASRKRKLSPRLPRRLRPRRSWSP